MVNCIKIIEYLCGKPVLRAFILTVGLTIGMAFILKTNTDIGEFLGIMIFGVSAFLLGMNPSKSLLTS